MYPYRLNRLFNHQSGRVLDVAVDHGLFGENAFLAGIENMNSVLDTLVQAAPDAIQLSLGQAKSLQQRSGAKPALVVRADVANVYGASLGPQLFSHHFPSVVEEAVQLDAVAICVNLMDIPGHPEIRQANITSILAIRREAERLGMPVMIEPLVMRDNEVAGGAYLVDGDVTKIVPLVRQACELGADLVKADPTEHADDYHKVVEAAGPTPVLVRGGGRVDDRTLLERTAAVLEQGAAGIVYGRNVIQHHDAAGLTAALMAMLHRGATVEEALGLVGKPA